MQSNINKEEIKNRLEKLKPSKTEDQLIERDSLILQANYLSEIERISKENGFNRKELALKIKTSPSYLTQVFRGDKPLNFLTLAKIKRALKIKFEVKATLNSEIKASLQHKINYYPLEIGDNVIFNQAQINKAYFINSLDKNIFKKQPSSGYNKSINNGHIINMADYRGNQSTRVSSVERSA